MSGATLPDPADSGQDLYQRMRDLNEKLLALNYQREFVSGYRCPPITRSYLINKIAGSSDNLRVDGFDDPNLTIEKILKAAHQYFDTSGFDKQKLKQGYGPEVIRFLDSLVDKLLAKVFLQDEPKIKVVVRSADGTQVDQNEDDDGDDLDNENEIEMEEEFEDYLEAESDLAVHDQWQDDSLDEEQQNDQQRQMIVANTDLTQWKMELERVLPQMNAQFLAGQQHQQLYQNREKIYDSEWRIHFKAAIQHHSAIESIFHQTDGMLRGITDNLGAMLDKIRSKENYLHQNANTILAEWINVRERALALRAELERAETELETRTQRLQEMAEEDRQTKQSIEEYSLKITDSAPLAEAKKARENLKQELTRINLQIGVAVQTLVRHVTLHSSYIH